MSSICVMTSTIMGRYSSCRNLIDERCQWGNHSQEPRQKHFDHDLAPTRDMNARSGSTPKERRPGFSDLVSPRHDAVLTTCIGVLRTNLEAIPHPPTCERSLVQSQNVMRRAPDAGNAHFTLRHADFSALRQSAEIAKTRDWIAFTCSSERSGGRRRASMTQQDCIATECHLVAL